MNSEQERLEQELAEVRKLTRCKTLDKCPDPRWKVIIDQTIEHKGQTFNRKLWVAVCGGSVEYTETLVEGKRAYIVERFELKPESWVKEKVLAWPCSHIVSDTYDIPEEAMAKVDFHKESITPFWWKVKKGEESKMEPLTLITDEREYVPETTKPGMPQTEEAWKKVEEERIAWEKAEKLAGESNPGTKLVCAKCGAPWTAPGSPAICPACGQDSFAITVEEEWEPSKFHSLMLHAVAEMYGPGGIVVDEVKAKATSCECVEYKPGKFWCTSKGVVGALTDEQEKIYCNPRVMFERPGMKERMAQWAESVEICRAQLPPTDGQTRLEIYLDCMSRELTKAGVEA